MYDFSAEISSSTPLARWHSIASVRSTRYATLWTEYKIAEGCVGPFKNYGKHSPNPKQKLT